MRKYFLKIVLFTVYVIGLSYLSCKPDSFTQEDAMILLNQLEKEKLLFADSLNSANVRYTYILSLVDASNSTFLKSGKSENGLSGANVTLGQDIILTTKTTNSVGLVLFDNLKPGMATMQITLKDFSEINAVLYFSNDTTVYGGKQIGTVIPMFAVSGSSLGTIKGKITYESDLTNKVPEPIPAGIKVIATVDPSSSALSNIKSDVIKSISYGSLSLLVTTDANGDYIFSVPSTSMGLIYSLKVSDFTANQTLFMVTKNGIPVSGIQTIPTQFGSTFSSGSSSIPHVVIPPTVSIGPPDYTYTPASATAVVTAGVVTSINVTDGGSNYVSGKVNVLIGSPPTGVTASATATVSGGRITSVIINTGGTNYINNPPVTITSTVQKEQANARALTNSDGSISEIILGNKGEGYLLKPSIIITGYGSGASAYAVVDVNTSLSSIILSNGGTGYLGINTPSSKQDAPSSIIAEAFSTLTSIKDIYLGTGHRTIEN